MWERRAGGARGHTSQILLIWGGGGSYQNPASARPSPSLPKPGVGAGKWGGACTREPPGPIR